MMSHSRKLSQTKPRNYLNTASQLSCFPCLESEFRSSWRTVSGSRRSRLKFSISFWKCITRRIIAYDSCYLLTLVIWGTLLRRKLVTLRSTAFSFSRRRQQASRSFNARFMVQLEEESFISAHRRKMGKPVIIDHTAK